MIGEGDGVGENPGNKDPDPETSSGYQSKKNYK